MLLELSLALQAATQSAQPIYGVAVAGDGDSITIAGQRIRLFGIDAPEFDQTCSRGASKWACGQESANQLSKLVTGREVRCVPTGTDAFDRVVARCSAAGVDINRTMVSLGYAVAFRKYSSEYVTAEQTARNYKRGLWSGTFQMPSEVRAGATGTVKRASRASPRARPQVAVSVCNIKGNRSRRGEWIYHVPGMPYYEQTRAEEVFCSEAEARAAGYRRALVR
jgi:endonuclease YncB( thermonuclease family)